MFEKVNPCHPDKVADRIAGAIVDLAYRYNDNPKIAVEVLLGHMRCVVMIESSVNLDDGHIKDIVRRIAGPMNVEVRAVQQDPILAGNQNDAIRCGDNGIFKGCVTTREQQTLVDIAGDIYGEIPSDGKYIIRSGVHGAYYETIICQSNLKAEDEEELRKVLQTKYCIPYNVINPLGEWTGGPDVDCGATNRKLGSDMGDAVTGGGLHGKDLSKADVSVNVWLHLLATKTGHTMEASCAIGDECVYVQDLDTKEVSLYPYIEIVEEARKFIFERCGGFEHFAEWGLIQPYYPSI